MTTEEGNKLIAELMEYDLQSAFPFIYARYGIEEVYKYLKYHSSWDWLIPAYAKFHKEVLHEIFQNKRAELSEQFSVWEHNFQAAVDVNSVIGAFDILVLALQWYNQNRKND